MIRTAAKLKFTALLGVGLMSCSNGDAKFNAPSSHAGKVNQTELIKVDNKENCIQANTDKTVSFRLTDGTRLSLKRDLIDAIRLSKTTGAVDMAASNFDEVSEVRFNLPWDYDDENCAKTVPAHIHKINLPKAGKVTDGFDPFKPTCTAIYAFEKLSSSELDHYFTESSTEKYIIGQTSLYRVKRSVRPQSSKVKPRFLDKQHRARVKYMRSARVLPIFFKDTPVTVYIKHANLSGFLDYGPSEYSPDNRAITLQFKMSNMYSTVISLKSSTKLMGDFEKAVASIELEDFHNRFTRLPYLAPKENLDGVISAYLHNLAIE